MKALCTLVIAKNQKMELKISFKGFFTLPTLFRLKLKFFTLPTILLFTKLFFHIITTVWSFRAILFYFLISPIAKCPILSCGNCLGNLKRYERLCNSCLNLVLIDRRLKTFQTFCRRIFVCFV